MGARGSDRALPPCGGVARAAHRRCPMRQGLIAHAWGTSCRWPGEVVWWGAHRREPVMVRRLSPLGVVPFLVDGGA
jgi:hypothetical protein